MVAGLSSKTPNGNEQILQVTEIINHEQYNGEMYIVLSPTFAILTFKIVKITHTPQQNGFEEMLENLFLFYVYVSGQHITIAVATFVYFQTIRVVLINK